MNYLVSLFDTDIQILVQFGGHFNLLPETVE